MSLKRLQLDPYYLAKIYTQSIIPRENTAISTPEKVVPPVKYLGENQKNMALFIQNENEAYLNEELFNLLSNILNACKLGMQDVALINISHYPKLTYPDFYSMVKIERGIIFGVTPAQLKLDAFPQYQPINLESTTLLFSDELQLINTNKLLKAKLWAGLKQLLS